MLSWIFVALLSPCPFVHFQGTSQPDTNDLKKLQGYWKLIDIESKEKPRQNELISKQDIIRHLKVTFEGNEYITIFGDEIQRQPFQLNESLDPKEIDVTRFVMPPMGFLKAGEKPGPLPVPKKEILKGIYELKDGKLKICLADSAKEERPKSFESALKAGNTILVLEKDTDMRASSRLSDVQLLGELRKLGVDAFGSGDRRDSGSIYVVIRGEDADKKLEAIAPILRKIYYVTGLHLHDCSVTDAGLAHLKDVNNIGHINLSQTKITDAGLAHLTGMTKLHAVVLNGTSVTEEGVAKLKKALPHLEVEKLSKVKMESEKAIQDAGGVLFTEGGMVKGIEFTLSRSLSDKELKQLEGPLEVWKDSLTRLSLANTNVSDLGLKSLYSLGKLKRLDLTKTKVTSAGVADLKQRLPGLQIKWSGE